MVANLLTLPYDVQFMDLGDSRLSGKMQDIPENIVDLEVDWEIDPEALQVLEKIGVPVNETIPHCWETNTNKLCCV